MRFSSFGSQSDETAAKPVLSLMEEKRITFELKVLSAHRNLDELLSFLRTEEKSFRIVIAAAGLSAALPGVIASVVKLPVIGIPLVAGPLAGMDALLSILQLPRGVPGPPWGSVRRACSTRCTLPRRSLASTRSSAS